MTAPPPNSESSSDRIRGPTTPAGTAREIGGLLRRSAPSGPRGTIWLLATVLLLTAFSGMAGASSVPPTHLVAHQNLAPTDGGTLEQQARVAGPRARDPAL
ncbi:MAG: hypothetical protein L3K17_09780, partial [Thermoplasmata archaeon]|nr:hypothetical protein [Thermoplasmata archaeon]